MVLLYKTDISSAALQHDGLLIQVSLEQIAKSGYCALHAVIAAYFKPYAIFAYDLTVGLHLVYALTFKHCERLYTIIQACAGN
jgi:hypothetical protein